MAIICGPIVRHANRNELNLWFVTDTPASTTDVKVLTSVSATANKAVYTDIQSIKLGEACYATMISATLQLAATTSVVYYDIVLDGVGFRESGFNSQICFYNEALPSIRLPKVHHHFLQSSCRKPHDEEGIDQLAYAAQHLADHLNADTRPTQLFLTGDQIYADDVSPILLYLFRAIRDKLGMPLEKIKTASGNMLNPEGKTLLLDSREHYANKQAGFTSGSADSHLLTFAEFVCMYLFSFGGYLAGLPLPEYKHLEPLLHKRRDPNTKRTKYNPDYTESDYKKERRALGEFFVNASGSVRKLFANISVYMIFDDHEVTDDWNLTADNQLNLSTSPLGRQVYVNALAAYTVFQHWGNQPKSVDAELRNQIQQLAADPSLAHHQQLEYLWQRNWGYILDQQPPVVVLDTRTGRVHGKHQLALMSPERMMQLAFALKELPASPTLILVSPTPVYGFSAIEAVQLSLGSQLKTFADNEPWAASEIAIQMLLESLAQLQGLHQIAIFSGDVHYAFARQHKWESKNITLWQLCSSAACNSPMGGNHGLKFLDNVVGHFIDVKTPYLLPKDNKRTFLISDKNIGTLTLDEHLVPIEASLLCCNPERKQYRKVYDLKDPKVLVR